MKILLYGINYSPELTGVGKYTGEMAEWLVINGHEVRVVTAPPYYPDWRVGKGYSSASYKKEEIRGVSVWRCPLYVPRQLSGMSRLLHLASFSLSSFLVMLLQVVWRPHLVWVVEPSLMCVPAAVLVSRLSGAKSWLHVQDFEVDAAFGLGIVKFGRLSRLIENLERWLMRCFDRVSTISEKMIDRLHVKGVSPEKIVFFPNWVDIGSIYTIDIAKRQQWGKCEDFRRKWGAGEESVVCLYSGNMGEKQGLEIVVEAARLMQARKDIVFVMCGEGGARSRLEKLSSDIPGIHWMPLQPYERLADLLNAADIHLLPQQANVADLVMPSKLTGIFASGRPVVATADAHTSVARVVEGRGVVVQPGNAKEFADSLAQLASDRGKRELLGKEARVFAVDQLDRESVLRRFSMSISAVVNG